MKKSYINYSTTSMLYNLDEHSFSFSFDQMESFVNNAKITKILLINNTILLSDYRTVEVEKVNLMHGRKLSVKYLDGPSCLKNITFSFLIERESIELVLETDRPEAKVTIEGDLLWGSDHDSTFAMCMNRFGDDIRTAYGPAVSKIDNSLFDRNTDSAIQLIGADYTRISYNWEERLYQFKLITSGLGNGGKCKFIIYEDLYKKKHKIPYKPMNKNTQFPCPPVGWMTWYSVLFNASEETVLENTYWMEKNLKSFGANCIWVDWEWYHSNMSGTETEGIDTFNPNKKRYPNGLKFVAEEIRKCGFIPALWIGATNDTNKNELLEKNSDWILHREAKWCGQWWIDPSNPEVVKEYVPYIFKQLLDWGYEVFKWDCLPITLRMYDDCHENFYDTTKNSEDSLRDLVYAARSIIGYDRYMLSCSGESFRDVTFAMDLFDGGRIGGDVFNWKEFINNSVKNILRYLCFNNIVFYADPDNVVIRSEFNNMDEAVSRVSLVALTGLSYTMGDHLPELEPMRVDLLKRTIPVLDIHPMDPNEVNKELDVILINLLVAKSFETWNVVDALNTTDDEISTIIDFDTTLHLEVGSGIEYLVFDYWNEELLGIREKTINVELRPHQSKVLAVRRLINHPQIISTSRHITQGGYDLNKVEWDEETRSLRGNSKVVQEAPYIITLYVPCGYNILKVNASCLISFENKSNNLYEVELNPLETIDMEWIIQFDKKE